jgi:hypothetical protein
MDSIAPQNASASRRAIPSFCRLQNRATACHVSTSIAGIVKYIYAKMSALFSVDLPVFKIFGKP